MQSLHDFAFLKYRGPPVDKPAGINGESLQTSGRSLTRSSHRACSSWFNMDFGDRSWFSTGMSSSSSFSSDWLAESLSSSCNVGMKMSLRSEFIVISYLPVYILLFTKLYLIGKRMVLYDDVPVVQLLPLTRITKLSVSSWLPERTCSVKLLKLALHQLHS